MWSKFIKWIYHFRLHVLSDIHNLNGLKTPRKIIFNYQYLKKRVILMLIFVFFLLLHKKIS